MIGADQWKDVEWPWRRWPNFTPKEMAERSEGWEDGVTPMWIDEIFMDSLQALRDKFGPLPISSGYRSPDYNNRISSTGRDGPHTKGRAADILLYGKDAFGLLAAIGPYGFTGVGIKQTGPYKSRFVHLDNLPGPNRPWVWSY